MPALVARVKLYVRVEILDFSITTSNTDPSEMAHMLPNTGVAFRFWTALCVARNSEVLISSSFIYTTSDSTIALLENTIIRIKFI